MQWRKIFAVARFEFLSVVKRWSFLIVTLAMPALLGLMLVGAGILQSEAMSQRAQAARVYAVVDHAAILGPQLAGDPKDPLQFVAFGSELEAERALIHAKLAGIFVLRADYLMTGNVGLVLAEVDPLEQFSSAAAEAKLADLLRVRLLAGRLEPALEKRVLSPMVVERLALLDGQEGGTRALDSNTHLAQLIAPLLVALLLMMALVGTSSYLLQGLGVEKENKVIEVLLACARADEIFAGKLLGLGAAGFVQFLVWSSLLALGFVLAIFGLATEGALLPWLALGAGLVFVPLGYFFIGSLMLTTGSLGSNTRESQQYAMIWASPVVLPMTLIGVLVSAPNGTLAKWLSWFPFTSPVAMVLRLSLARDQVPLWEVAGSAGVLLVCTWASVVLGARLFRAGLLMSGSAFSFRGFLEKARLR